MRSERPHRSPFLVALLASLLTLAGCAETKTDTQPKSPTAPKANELPSVADNTLCHLAGEAGTVVSCPVRIASKGPSHHAYAIQLRVEYDSSAAEFIGFDGKATVEGHQLLTKPPKTTDWRGSGIIFLVNISKRVPITSAIATGDDIQGEPRAATIRFRLLRSIDRSARKKVVLSDIVASDPEAQAIPVVTRGGLLITGPAE